MEPPETQKRKPYEPLEGTPGEIASNPMPTSAPPASGSSDKLGVKTSSGSSPIAIDPRDKMLANLGQYFASIGCLVEETEGSITIG